MKGRRGEAKGEVQETEVGSGRLGRMKERRGEERIKRAG